MKAKVYAIVLLVVAGIFNSCEKSAPPFAASDLSGSWIGTWVQQSSVMNSFHFLANNKVEVYVFKEDSQGGILGYQSKTTATYRIDDDILYIENPQELASKDQQFVKLDELTVASSQADISYRLISVDKMQGKLVLGSICGANQNCIPPIEYHKTSTPVK